MGLPQVGGAPREYLGSSVVHEVDPSTAAIIRKDEPWAEKPMHLAAPQRKGRLDKGSQLSMNTYDLPHSPKCASEQGYGDVLGFAGRRMQGFLANACALAENVNSFCKRGSVQRDSDCLNVQGL